MITGSANLSYPALKGNQSEIIIEFDHDGDAYDAHMLSFLRDKQDSSISLDIDTLNLENRNDVRIQETPILGVIEKETEVKIPTPVSINDTDNMEPDDFIFINNVKDIIADETAILD